MANKRKCKFCGTYTKEYIVTPTAAFCNYDHAILFAQSKQQQDKVKKQRRAQEKRKLNERKKKLRAKSWYVKSAQTTFNAYIRERDKGKPCISCDTIDPNLQYHAGHYKTTKAHPELRFEELNCHLQCSVCNNHLSGNIHEYRKRLIKRIGIDKVEWLEGFHKLKRYRQKELEDIKKYYVKLKKDLT